jgi:hypothetical protein
MTNLPKSVEGVVLSEVHASGPEVPRNYPGIVYLRGKVNLAPDWPVEKDNLECDWLAR